tara:strand:+ start:139076 stop:140344 length:1269 start_codon:yes stop_codon:yes gene_type:complete
MSEKSISKNISSEVCIIGAGPSGIVTALFLAKKGISSIVLDKFHFPRPKPCADCITGNTLRILKEINPQILDQLVKEEKMKAMHGINAFSSNTNKIKFDFLALEAGTDEASCYTIKREDFDYAIFKEAQKNKLITLREGFHVKNIFSSKEEAFVEEKNGEKIIAKVLVNASGSNSNLQKENYKSYNKDSNTAIGIRAYFENIEMNSPDYCELFLSRSLMPGGMYISPMTHNQANVNLVLRIDKLKKHEIDLKKIFDDFLENHPIVKNKFKNAIQLEKFAGSQLRLGTVKRKIHGDRFIMVGDAAGLIDILSANGIPQAFMSGKIAAEHLAEAFAKGDFSSKALLKYEKAIFKATKNYLRMGRIASPFMKSEKVLDLVDLLLNKFSNQLENNKALEALVYNKKYSWNIINPKYYRRFFFGMKN